VNVPRAVGVYRRLLAVYPRRFRDEYRTDMVLLFTEQLRDEPAGRVWARAVVDLAITVPTRHLEAHMKRPPLRTMPLLFATVSVTGLVFAILAGSNLAMFAVGLTMAVVAGALAAVAWFHTRVLTTPRPVSAHWWKFLAYGAGALAAMIVATAASYEFDDSLWWPMVLVILSAVVTLAVGFALGIVHLIGLRWRRAPT
jgi:hypothetical protein